MSYEIEYNKKVYKRIKKDSSENDLLLLIRQGSNNCYEAGTGQRVKDWDLVGYGWNYMIIQKICDRAGACEGGSLQKAKGYESEYITPEDYLAMYRKKIETAKPIEDLLKDFNVSVMIYRKDKFSEKEIEDKNLKYELKIIDEVLEKYKKDYSLGKDYYDKSVKTYGKKINNMSEFYDFLKLPRWNTCRSKECYNSFGFIPIRI